MPPEKAPSRPRKTRLPDLATIAHGDGICITHVTAPSAVHIRDTTAGTVVGAQPAESGGIFA
jgi:hypothetical protein